MKSVHVGAHHELILIAGVVAGMGTLKLLALRFEGHPLADAWLNLF